MNGQDPLSQLRDIQLPETGGWWPPAPGWWALLILLCLFVVGSLLWWRHRRQHSQWRRDTLAELRQLEKRAEPHPDWFGELNALLKRTARHAFPDRRPESLSGNAWRDFLLETMPPGTGDEEAIEAMITACWQPVPTLPPSKATDIAKTWLEARS